MPLPVPRAADAGRRAAVTAAVSLGALALSPALAPARSVQKLTSNGELSASIRTAERTTQLRVRARGRQCKGAPRMKVSVDGRIRLSAAVSKTKWTTYRSTVSIAAGAHRVVVRFTNDRVTKGCHRTLFVDHIQLATAPAGGPAPAPAATPAPTPTRPAPTPTPTVAPTVPVPTPTSAPTPSGIPVADVFSADLSRGAAAFPIAVNPQRIQAVDDPVLGAARPVLKFTVYPTDLASVNPRAQLEMPYTFREGDDRYFGFSYNFPASFPAKLPSGGWVTLGAIAYGPPFAGAAPVSLRVQNSVDGSGAQLRWQRNDTYGDDIAWEGPKIAAMRGRWMDFVLRTKLSGNPDVGFVELWMNTGSGWVRQKLKGQDRLYMRTYDSSNNGGPNNSRICLYYRKDIPGPLTMYHGAARVATASPSAFAAVAPHSYG